MNCKENREKIFNLLKNNEIAIFFSSSRVYRNGDMSYFPFRQNSDFYYLTGITTPDNLVILHKNHLGQSKSMLFIYKPSRKEEIYDDSFLSPTEAKKISKVDYVYFLQDIEDDFLNDLLHISNKLYICNRDIPLSPMLKKIKDFFLKKEVFSVQPLIEKARLFKSQKEIQYIKKAIQFTYEALLNSVPLIKEGNSEKEIYGNLMGFYYSKKNLAPSFNPIVASGKNATILHYTALKSKLGKGDLLLIDTGAEYKLYAGDITRVFPVSGRFSKEQIKIYEAVLFVKNELQQIIKPGYTINELNQITTKKILEQLIKLKLIKSNVNENSVKEFFPHGLSHFIGLDVHDCGNKDTVLAPGMIISCEPAIYIKSKGIGIRLEDDLLITKTKNINLSVNIPIDPGNIEKLFN